MLKWQCMTIYDNMTIYDYAWIINENIVIFKVGHQIDFSNTKLAIIPDFNSSRRFLIVLKSQVIPITFVYPCHPSWLFYAYHFNIIKCNWTITKLILYCLYNLVLWYRTLPNICVFYKVNKRTTTPIISFCNHHVTKVMPIWNLCRKD